MKISNQERALRRVVAEFKRRGLLLESDGRLPSVAGLVVGEPVKGSWWGHPKGKRVWKVLKEFCERKDVLATKMVSGKVTFVHRRLWPSLLALGTAREGWQINGLSSDAKTLLRVVELRGEVRTDTPGLTKGPTAAAALGLERRLLIQSEEIHTSQGFHAKRLRSWKSWSRGKDFTSLPTALEAKARFEGLLRVLNEEYDGDGRPPWT